MAGRFFGMGRVSGPSQVEGESLEGQDDWNFGTVATREKMTEVYIRVDDVISSQVPLRKRPNAGKVFENLKRGDHMSFSKLDRAFRSMSDFINTRDFLQEIGVILHLGDVNNGHACTGPNVSAETKMMMNILASYAEMERARLTERVREGVERMRQRLLIKAGVNTGRPPFWTDDKNVHKNIPDKKKLIRERILNEMYKHGDAVIARKLTEAGIPTERGANEWSGNTIKTIFHNPALRGILVLKRRVLRPSQHDDKKMVQAHVPIPEYPAIPGFYEPIIEEDEFELLAQIRRNRVKGNPGGKTGKFLNVLRDLVECWDCHTPASYIGVVRTHQHQRGPNAIGITGRLEDQDGRTRYGYFKCRKAFQHGDCEWQERFPYWVAESLVLVVLELVSMHNEWWHSTPEQIEADKLRAEIEKKQGTLDRVSKKWKGKRSLEQQIDELDAELADMKDRLDKITTPGRLAELYAPPRLQYLLDLHQRGLAAASEDERADIRREENTILRAAIQKVIIKRATEITIQLQPTFGSFLEITFDDAGDYLHHGTRDVTTGRLVVGDPKIKMAELNRLLNKWGFDDPKWLPRIEPRKRSIREILADCPE